MLRRIIKWKTRGLAALNIKVFMKRKLLTEYLAKNGAAIFAEAGAASIKRICELHECIAFVHGYSWNNKRSWRSKTAPLLSRNGANGGETEIPR